MTVVVEGKDVMRMMFGGVVLARRLSLPDLAVYFSRVWILGRS